MQFDHGDAFFSKMNDLGDSNVAWSITGMKISLSRKKFTVDQTTSFIYLLCF